MRTPLWLVAVALLLLAGLLLTMNRYRYVELSAGLVRIDRLTGAASELTDHGWRALE